MTLCKWRWRRNPCNRNTRHCVACCSPAPLALVVSPAVAADVTSDRLVNADKEPQNWLMNHRTYDAQRFSPLDEINKANVKSLKLAYAVAIGGTSANENLQATPLAEDGFLYVVDQWGVLYKIDGRSGDWGRIVWRMDPGQEKLPLSNRGAALWGNLVVTTANYPPRVIATNKETGRIAWETNLSDGQPDIQLTAAPLAVKDKIVLGAAGGDRGTRDFIVALDAATGKTVWRKYVIPAPGEPGSRDLEGQEQRLGDRRRRHVGDGFLRRCRQPGDLGHRQPGAGLRRDLPPRRQPLHQQRDLVGRRLGQDELVLPVHAGRPLGLRRGRYAHPGRRAGRRPAPQGDHPFGAQRLPLHDGAQQRPDAAGQALSRQHQLDERHRPEDRQAARLQSQQRCPALFRRRHADARRVRPRRCAPARPAATTSGPRPTA